MNRREIFIKMADINKKRYPSLLGQRSYLTQVWDEGCLRPETLVVLCWL
jgi:hypothetical protein